MNWFEGEKIKSFIPQLGPSLEAENGSGNWWPLCHYFTFLFLKILYLISVDMIYQSISGKTTISLLPSWLEKYEFFTYSLCWTFSSQCKTLFLKECTFLEVCMG